MINLKSILDNHKCWLENFREGARANLRGVYLSGANLRGVNLSGSILPGACLLGANLSGADLSEANLSEANLSEADLSEANLSYANLSGADLSKANLSHANLMDANLSYANLSGANLMGTNLWRANLSYAYLLGANLTGANLTDADLTGANLPSVTTESHREKMKPFGYSYLLDMYGCNHCDDLEINYRFLEQLVERLGMTRMSQPIVIHGPTIAGMELFPDKAGVSGWVPLIESGIQIHTLTPKRFITLDVYSCKWFPEPVAFDFAKSTFGFSGHEAHYIQRGTLYNDP